MTTFFSDLRVSRNSDEHYIIVSVEVPAPDLPAAVHMLMAFKAGLAANPNFGRANEESVYGVKRRGVTYLTMREAAMQLKNELL